MTRTEDWRPEVPADDPRLIAALEEYLAALESGRRPDRGRFLARHAELGDALARCLDGLDFVHSAVPQLQQDSTARPAPAPWEVRPGFTLGDYRVVRELGRGGMGIVYEAEQISLGRRVALKVLPFAAALDSKQLQRFKHEAQAAAHLHHPHIVPVHAVGCESGVHYYVMQFIEGHNLAQVVASLRLGRDSGDNGSGEAEAASARRRAAREDTAPLQALSTEHAADRPAFFRTVAAWGVQAAEALDHAHQLGVVHRDVKPGNLLLDRQGQVWVTDFGLARSQADTDLTGSGDLIGTLRYMSPEQVQARHGLVGHQTDVYSLGATLYELLTLRAPFRSHNRQALIQQIIHDDPVPPRRLNRDIPVDLETIVLKAMAKSPGDRYATAQAMADDLRRFLDDRPILAQAPTLRDRAWKWLRHHRRAVGVAAAFFALAFVGLAAFSATVSYKQRQTNVALEKARKDRQFARKAVNDMYAQFAARWLKQPRLEPVQEEFLRKALAYYQELAADGGTDAETQRETVLAYERVGSIQQQFGRFREAEEAYQKGIATARGLLAGQPADPATAEVLAQLHNNLGIMLARTGRIADAELAYRQAIQFQEQLLASDPTNPHYQKNLASNCDNCATALMAQGRWADAAVFEARSLKAREDLASQFPNSVEHLELLASTYLNAGVGRWHTGRYPEAERLWLRAEELLEQLLEAHPNEREIRDTLAQLQGHLGALFDRTDRLAKAEAAMRKALEHWRRLGADYPQMLRYKEFQVEGLYNLGLVLRDAGRIEEAEKRYREALDAARRLARDYPEVPEIHTRLVKCLNNLGNLLADTGRLADAEQFYREARATAEPLARSDRAAPDILDDYSLCLNNLGHLYWLTDRSDEAGRLLEEAVAVRLRLVQSVPDVPRYREPLAGGYVNLARYHRDRGQAARAEQAYRQALAEQKRLADQYPEVVAYAGSLAGTHAELAGLLLPSRRPAALEELATAERVLRQALERHKGHPAAQRQLAWFLANGPDPASRRPAEAAALAQAAKDQRPADPANWTTLGAALVRHNEYAAAIAALDEAVKLRGGGDSVEWLFLAQAHWHAGRHGQAREYLALARSRLEQTHSKDADLRDLLAETAGICREPSRAP